MKVVFEQLTLFYYFIFNIFVESGDVELKTYESNFEGLIQSWVDRFPTLSATESLLKLWEKDYKHFYNKN